MKTRTILYDQVYTITSDKSLMCPAEVYQWLSQESYWAKNIPEDIFKASFEHSFCTGVIYQNQQVGFARMITDYATFGYMADVYVLPAHRGKGLAKAMVGFMLEPEWVAGLRRIMLASLDAQAFYEPFGFTPILLPERLMERKGVLEYH